MKIVDVTYKVNEEGAEEETTRMVVDDVRSAEWIHDWLEMVLGVQVTLERVHLAFLEEFGGATGQELCQAYLMGGESFQFNYSTPVKSEEE